MGILQPPQQLAGSSGVIGAPKYMTTTDSLATITAAGYLNNIDLGVYPINANDVLSITYNYNLQTNSGTYEQFTASISNGIITLIQFTNPGDVLLPVVSGDFATFNGTSGQIKDAGFLPSDATKTKVVMSSGAITLNHVAQFADTNGTIKDGGVLGTAAAKAASDNTKTTVASVAGATIINHIATYTDTAGTIGEDAATAINGGNIQAGLSGTAGTLASFPGTAANGSFIFKAINNAGNFNSTLSNSNVAQAIVYSLPDTTSATANVLAAGAALVSGNLSQASGTLGAIVDSGIAALNVSMTKVFTLTAGQLATAGKVNIQVHTSGTSQYFIQDVKVLKSTGLSGGGGDRLLAISDGTVVFNNAGITAALLGTPIFTIWSGTGNPIPAGTTDISTAGADIFFQYTGGTTDFAAGSVQIAVTYVKVTA